MTETVGDYFWERMSEWNVNHLPLSRLWHKRPSGRVADGQCQVRSHSGSPRGNGGLYGLAYAKFTGELGVCLATSGPGASHLLNSLYDARMEISRRLTQTNQVVHTIAAEAQSTNAEIGGLAAAAQKIGDVVKIIQNIAGQTNLLALNATIEAARAGEAGRGFAVVAHEVKLLAVQTAKATEEISGQIAAVQSSSTEVLGAIRVLAGRMQEINTYSSAVTTSVLQQNAATDEITHNVSSAALGTEAIVTTQTDVAGAATEARHSAQTMLDASEAAETAATILRNEVNSFLQKVAV